MPGKLKRLAGHSLIYGMGSALAAVGGFVLIPLYTNVLKTDEYGILELLNRTADILMIVMFLGVRQAYIRFYFDKDDEEWRKKVTGTVFIFVVASSLIIISLAYPLKGLVTGAIFKGAAPVSFFVLMLAWLPAEMISNVGMTHLQIRMKPYLYVGVNFMKLLLIIGGNLALVYKYRMGITGIYATNIVASGLIAIGFSLYLIRWSGLKASVGLLKELVRFGAPYLPTAFFMYIISNSDRYILSMYSTLGAVGVYALAYKLGMVGTSLLMDPFSKVWAPFLFENYNKDDGPAVISKVFLLFTLVNVAAALVIATLSPLVLPLISAKAYHGAYAIIPLICLASIFYNMTCIVDAGILISKKTYYKPIIFGVSALVGLGLNFLLVPRYGEMGAAAALAFTFFTLFIITHAVSNRFFEISIEARKMSLIFASSFATYFISFYLIRLAGPSGVMKVLSVASLSCFPAILWVGGFFSENEKKAIRRLFAR